MSTSGPGLLAPSDPCHTAAGAMTALVDEVHAILLEQAGADVGGLERDEVLRVVRRHRPLDPGHAVSEVVDRVLARIDGLGAIAPLLSDPRVSDVLVNGGGAVWVEREGQLERTDVVLTASEVLHMLERILAPLGLRLDRTSPLVDARLPDGSRVNAVVPPLACDGPCLAIRRFGVVERSLADFCPADVVDLLSWAVRSGQNLLVSGGTGAGKTSLLNALAAELPPVERIVTIEDVAELRLAHEHVVRLEARPSNGDGVGSVGIRELVRNALRLRPDRIIVGEVRGPEALDMLQAMNTGHEGSLSTLHANSPRDALRRLETMVLLGDSGLSLDAVREQIAGSVDMIVQVARAPGGRRSIVAIGEPDGQGGPGVRLLVSDGEMIDGPHRLGRRGAGPSPDPRGPQRA